MWVIVAGVLVMFMQAGFLLLEVGFSRAKNAGAGVAKILVNFSIASLCYWAVGFALAFGGLGTIAAGPRVLPQRRLLDRRSGQEHPVRRNVFDQPGRVHVLPVRVLRGLAGDRLGRHAGADQVQRVHHLRGDLQRRALPGAEPLDLRWRLAAGQRRHAGLRRLDGGPPDRCDRGLRGAAAARPADRQVHERRQAAGDPGALDAAGRPRRADPLARLVRVQPGLDPGRDRRLASPKSSWSPTSRRLPAWSRRSRSCT